MHGLLSVINIDYLQGFAAYDISKETTSRRCVFHAFCQPPNHHHQHRFIAVSSQVDLIDLDWEPDADTSNQGECGELP